MTDRVYPFGINVNYRTYPDAGVIETWVDAVNNGKKMSSCANLRRAICRCAWATVYLTSFYGSWANDTRMEEEPLTHGMKIIKNKDGLRNTHTAHPEVMFSLDGRPRENEGRVIGAAPSTPAITASRIDTDDSDYHHFFAGINEDNSAYTLAKGETFTTPALALAYLQEGKGGVSRQFHTGRAATVLLHGTETRKILLNSWRAVLRHQRARHARYD